MTPEDSGSGARPRPTRPEPDGPGAGAPGRGSLALGWRVGVVVFLGGIGGGLVFPILPILGVQLGISAGLIGLILAANRITRLVANPLTGQVVDRLGGKIPLTAGLVIEALATFLYSFALGRPDPGLWFLLGRAVWGLGSSLLIVGGVAAVLKASSFEDRGRLTSVVRSAQAIGMPMGLVLGGLIAGLWSNNAAFLSSAFLTLTAALIAATLLPGSPRNSDPQPASAAAAANPWKALTAMVRDRRLLTVWAVNFLIFLTLQGLLITTLVLLIDHRHLTLFGLAAEPTSGLLMAVMLAWSAGVTVIVGRLLDRLPERTGIVLPALGCLVAGFVLLAVAHSLPLMLLGLAALGAAMGGTSLPLLALMGDLVPAEMRGRAVGWYQTFGDGGGSLGPIIGVWEGLHVGFTTTYLGTAALVALFSPLVLGLWLAERRDAARTAAPPR